MKNYKILFLFLIFSTLIFSQTTDTLKKNQHFELSFGQSLLFISSSKLNQIHTEESIVLPTSAILFFAEFRPQKRMRIPVFFNLPTETKQFLLNGALVNEKSSPTLGTGLEFKLFQIKIDEKSKIECELGPLASFIFDSNKKLRVAPIIAGRIRIMRGENFVMYFGASYSFGIDALGILYGTGTIF
ncbi:MAG: hypothetical protein V4622_10085 [Bacteroidota bacterium]